MFTRNRVFKHKDVVSNLHDCIKGLSKIWASNIFHFSTRILSSTHMKKSKIFFVYYMSRCPTINFHHSIMSKWITKHISTNVSFKITIRTTNVYIEIRWPWIWKQYFQLRYLKRWSYFNDRFGFFSARYTVKFTEHIWNWDSYWNLTH